MYYPKSQIQTNLYSNGELSILSTKQAYTGWYWTTSSGKCFSGRNPSSKPPSLALGKVKNKGFNLNDNEPAAQPPSSYIASSLNTLQYSQLMGVDFRKSTSIPTYSPPKPTLKDYKNRFFTRFLCRKINESLFIEISSKEYIKLKNEDEDLLYELYPPFKLNWVITGELSKVINENRISIEYLENTQGLVGLGDYLRHNYKQLYGLYTKGGEYLLPNGKEYTGLYHLDSNKIPMVGRTHISSKHNKLTPIGDIIPPNIYNGPTPPPTPTTSGGSGY